MKKLALIPSVILGLGLLLFCSNSAPQTARDTLPSLPDFDALHVGSAIKVIISNAYRNVEIECTPTMRQRLDINVVNDVLNIRLRPGTSISSSLRLSFRSGFDPGRITVYLPMRAYRHIKAAGASKVDILNRVTTENIIFDLSGAAKITGSVNANEVQVFTSGASKITLGGTANTVRVESTSSSKAECSKLRSRRAVCKSTSAAKISVYASESFEGEATSASRINCLGAPREKRFNTSSAAKINFN